MKGLLSLVLALVFSYISPANGQGLCFSGPFSVTNSYLNSSGNQIHTVDVTITNTTAYTLEYSITSINGGVLQSGTSLIFAGETQDHSFDLVLNNTENTGVVSISIINPPAGFNNPCGGNQSFALPKVPVCLEIINSFESGCRVDNDGIENDGDVHSFTMQVRNNDIAPFSFTLTGTQDFQVTYHPDQYILPGDIVTVTYEIYSTPGVPASGELAFIFENQNFTNGCETPMFLTFQPCQQSVCLEFGAITHNGCTDNNGIFYHTYIAEISNQSNIPLEYNIKNISGGSIYGATSLTIAPLSTETINFEYKPVPGVTNIILNLEIVTPGISNECFEIVDIPLPDCSNQSDGSMNLLAFFDQNNNGVYDASEQGLPNINFTVTNQSTGASTTATSNSLGQAYIANLTPGLYLINQEVNLPWSVTNPVGGSTNNVLVNSNQVTTYEFANYHPNAGITPIKIHSLDAVCIGEQSTGNNIYKIYGTLSTSFFEPSMLSVSDLQNSQVSNMAIGPVPPLASYVPFSFDYITDQNNIDLLFSLSVPLALARDTFNIILPACCNGSGGFASDTSASCESVKISYGAYVPAGNNSIRLGEVIIEDFQPCTNKIIFQSNDNLFTNGEHVIDGVQYGQVPTNEFIIPAGAKKLTFYIDAVSGSGKFTIISEGCQTNCTQEFTTGPNFNTSPAVSISQETPAFSNIYGATFSINKISGAALPKFVSFGLASNNSGATLIGVTAADYYLFGGRQDLIHLDEVKNDSRQVHMTLNDFIDYDALKFNFLYSGSRKDVDVRYFVYAADGTLIGKGEFTLEGAKVVSNISDPENTEDEVAIFPNPAPESINVKVQDSHITGTLTYSISNLEGKVMRLGSLSTSTTNVSLTGLLPGAYIICVKDGVKVISNNKFLKL